MTSIEGVTAERRTGSTVDGESEATGETPESGRREDRAGTDLTPDDAFDVLRNPRRRQALRLLADRDEPTALTELASAIAAIENDKHRDDVTSTERKRVYISLYQCHAPKMAEVGAVVYEDDDGIVTLTDTGAELASLLADYTGTSRDRGTLYPVLTAASLGLAVVAVSGPFLELAALFAGAGLAFAFTAVVNTTQ